MYKRNGEEAMTREECIGLREQVAERKKEREKAAELIAEVLGTEMYACLTHVSSPRDHVVEAAYAGS